MFTSDASRPAMRSRLCRIPPITHTCFSRDVKDEKKGCPSAIIGPLLGPTSPVVNSITMVYLWGCHCLIVIVRIINRPLREKPGYIICLVECPALGKIQNLGDFSLFNNCIVSAILRIGKGIPVKDNDIAVTERYIGRSSFSNTPL